MNSILLIEMNSGVGKGGWRTDWCSSGSGMGLDLSWTKCRTSKKNVGHDKIKAKLTHSYI